MIIIYINLKIRINFIVACFFIIRVFFNFIKRDSLYWAITLSDQNIFVGTICLFGFSDENYKCEIGYELLTNFQGQGIMSEAVEKVIDYAFNTIKVKKIETFLHRDNQSSIKLLEKFSFRNSIEPDKTNPNLICYHLTNSIDNLNKHLPKKPEPLIKGFLLCWL